MALSYDDWKNQWEGMTDVQRARVSQSMKDNATFQDYGKRYVQEQKGVNINPTGYQNNTQNTGSTVSNNQNGGANNTEGTNTQQTVETPQNETNNTEPTQGAEGNGGKYGKTEFDPEETLQEDKFGTDPGKITIYEGTGKDTGRPDYTINTDERLKEMAGNLDHYYATQPTLFNDRKTFNEFFQYNDRPSDEQRALLDSYWKKAQDHNKAMSYTSGDALAADLNSGNMTQDVWNQVMEGNQKAYIEWQERMKNELELAIANFAAPFNPDTLADTLQSLVNKLGIQAGDPYDIIGGWENKMQELGAYQSLHELDSTVNQLKSVASQRQNIINRYASSAGGTQSDALVAARLNKALAPYDQQFSDLYTLYQTQHTTYQTKLGTANQYAQVMYQQAQEDQRIFNNKIKSLGFAMEVNSYRTPEQQAQLGLQVQSIQNDMNLLNKAKQNDLALYNMAAETRLKSQLQSELTDLSVEDPKQLRANLNNILSEYYKEYGDIIQRPQSQALDDILEYAKANGISVAQALKENFLTPLQGKQEYAQAVADKYGMNPTQSIQTIGDKVALVTKYPNGKLSYQFISDAYNPKYDLKTINGKSYLVVDDGKGIPQLKYIGGDGTVLNYASLTQGLQSFMTKYEDGTFYKEKGCGYFCNEFLTSIGDSGHVGSTWESKKALCKNKDWANMVVGSIVAMDTGATYTNDKGEKVNAGHVSIVAGYDPETGKVLLYDANRDGKGNVSYHETTVDKLYGYYTPEVYKNNNSLNLPDYLDNLNEYGFVDAMTGNYGQYIIGKLNNVSINRLGGDKVIQDQINNWFNYLNTKGKNKNGYIDGLEDLYENYLENGSLPASAYIGQLGGTSEFISQAKAYGKSAGYGRYAKVNDKGYYDDLTNLYDEYNKSNKVPTEAQVEAYGGLDDFFRTARAYSNSVGFRYTPDEQDKEIESMRDKWLTSQEYKDMVGRIDALESINAMLTTGKGAYGDYTAIYLLNKLRDPDSVVREGEFANTQNVGGIDDKIYNYFKKLQNGERLNDSQRIEIQNTLNSLMKAKIDVYNNSLRQYRSHAIKGGDTSNIGDLYQISKKGKVSFGNLTGNAELPPHSELLD